MGATQKRNDEGGKGTHVWFDGDDPSPVGEVRNSSGLFGF